MDELRERIEMLISTRGMTNATFAEKVGVQPSNISHVLSGRNKASLDLVMKILNSFKEVRTEWLLHGRGSMTRDYTLFEMEETEQPQKTVKKTENNLQKSGQPSMEKPIEEPSKVESVEKTAEVADNKTYRRDEKGVEKSDQKNEIKNPHKKSHRKIERIVIFYEDRSFMEYYPGD